MTVEVLYFKGCPTYEAAVMVVTEVLAETGIDAEVELVCVETDEDAKRLHFPGSPTIRVEGRDLFPVPERGTWVLGCRMYITPEGLKGWPTPQMLREALAVTSSS
jgi:hypothetical protein